MKPFKDACMHNLFSIGYFDLAELYNYCSHCIYLDRGLINAYLVHSLGTVTKLLVMHVQTN